MAIPKRRARMPGTYFVTSRTWERRSLFAAQSACQIFIEALFHYRDQGDYQLHAFVLMPEHFHVLITPTSDVTLERVVQYIKGGSARRMGEELRLRFPVWQRGFSDHRIRDAEDYQTHVRYIEQNPVKERLVEVPSEYPWSSASDEFQLNETPQGLKPWEEKAFNRHGSPHKTRGLRFAPRSRALTSRALTSRALTKDWLLKWRPSASFPTT